jgi:hypothetical protein
MSKNEAFINELVTENTALVIYSDDNEFTPLPVNYKIAEKAFLSDKGRAFSEDELEEVKSAFAARAVKDKEFVESTAVEACDLHHGLIMTGTTLDDGIDSFTEAVSADVKEALSNRGISYTYKLETHVPSVIKLRNYIDAAQTLEA